MSRPQGTPFTDDPQVLGINPGSASKALARQATLLAIERVVGRYPAENAKVGIYVAGERCHKRSGVRLARLS